MEKPYIRQLFHPKLEAPIFIEGLPGFGNVGKIAARLMIQFSEAKLFAEYYSPYFPDYVSVSKDGICSAPRYKFYAPPQKGKLDAVVLTGDSQPPLDNVTAHYEICEELLDFAVKHGCAFVVTIGGVPVSTGKKDVYVAATSSQLAAEVVDKGSSLIYRKGRIMGATGLLLGLAKERGLRGICLLGATAGVQSDKDAGFAVYNLLLKILGKMPNSTHDRGREKG
ncbi:MAG: PAC2 family protein [Candidatus Bathyarchaeota archaeon]|nr:MAG: PAC2 family protein [Candidatus Bathyarchaeota archaeon]